MLLQKQRQKGRPVYSFNEHPTFSVARAGLACLTAVFLLVVLYDAIPEHEDFHVLFLTIVLMGVLLWYISFIIWTRISLVFWNLKIRKSGRQNTRYIILPGMRIIRVEEKVAKRNNIKLAAILSILTLLVGLLTGVSNLITSISAVFSH